MRGFALVAGLVVLAALMSGHRDRLSTPLVVAILGLAGLFILRKLKRSGARQDQLFDALDAHIGAKRDHEWVTYHSLQAYFLVTWSAQGKFYFARANSSSFTPADIYCAEDIRSWAVEKATQLKGRRLVEVYSVNIAVKRADNALLKFHCGKNEKLAYAVNEVFAQMYGDHS